MTTAARLPLEVQLLTSPDLLEMDTRQPDDPADFLLLVQALIGVRGEEGAESFDFVVCTPGRLAAEVPEGGALPGRGYLFVRRYEYRVILAAIQQLCDEIDAPDWDQAAALLCRHARWEYEGQ